MFKLKVFHKFVKHRLKQTLDQLSGLSHCGWTHTFSVVLPVEELHLVPPKRNISLTATDCP